jgi:predicted transcriptional regulator
MKKHKSLKVKTGKSEEFFEKVKKVMRDADKNKPIEGSYTLTFEDPKEMLHFLTDKKINLIKAIRKHPDTITNIAKAIKRNRAAVYRDINEMEKFGLVKTHEEVNPGHGRHKIVEMVSSALKLEANI